MMFFNVSGGPTGSEQIISSGGPLFGISLLIVFAFAYSAPQALMTAELSTAFPQNGGYSLWVQSAFGTFWGTQESYWSYIAGVVDNALYPVAMYSAIVSLWTGSGSDHNALPTCTASQHMDSHADLLSCMFVPHSGCSSEYLAK